MNAAVVPSREERRRVRALVSERAGPPETLVLGIAEIPDPTAGELLIRVEACGINYPDVLMIEDKYQFPAPRPFVPGIEICGIIEQVGPDVHDFRPGSRVVAQIERGGLAEQAIAKASASYLLPHAISAEIGASMLLTYATSFHALRDRAALRPGETLLVLGAAGGVGLAAIDLGKAMGARVVGAVSSEVKAAVARAAGADHVIVYPPEASDTTAFVADLRAASPDGFNVIYDPVGGDYAEPALRRVAWGGRYLVVGFAAGIPKIALNLVLLKGCELVGVFWGAYASRDPEGARRSIDALFELLNEGRIAPRQPTLFPLARGGDAIGALRDRLAIGKLVVLP